LAGDTHVAARLVGLTDAQHAGGDADAELVARWLDDGITPNGEHGRAFGQRGVHGFDLTFCAPKSVSLVRALRTDDVVAKAIADAHTTALGEAIGGDVSAERETPLAVRGASCRLVEAPPPLCAGWRSVCG
jgi:hypothetical protein